MYSPELKRQMEMAQEQGTSPALSRGEALSQHLVRRVQDAEWVPMTSPEAERILTEWTLPGPDGAIPTVCTP